MIPDLQELLARWQARFKMRDWRIRAEYVDDLRNDAGEPVYGLCRAFKDDRRARIQLRTPTTADEAARVPEALLHELTHALISPIAGDNREPASITAEEQIVWTLAPLLAELEEPRRDDFGPGDGPGDALAAPRGEREETQDDGD